MTLVFEVDAVDGKGIGIDRNMGQVADSTRKIWYDTSDHVKKLQKRLLSGSQRYGKLLKTIRRHQQENATIRQNDLRHMAKGISPQSDLILKTKSMTTSVKGTVENPVKQKTGLNRVIRVTGWDQLERYLEERGVVVKVHPPYSSQRCSKCGHKIKENRKTQRTFLCQSCNHQLNADVNAAFNIRASFNGCGVYIRPEAHVLKRQSEFNHHLDI